MQLRLRGQWAFILGGYFLTCIIVIGLGIYNNNTIANGIESVKNGHFPAYTFIVRMESKIELFNRTLNEAVLTGDSDQLTQSLATSTEIKKMFEKSHNLTFTDFSQKVADFEARFNDYSERIAQLAKQLIQAQDLQLTDAEIQELARKVAEDRRLVEFMLQELVNNFEKSMDSKVHDIQLSAQRSIERTITLAVVVLITFTVFAMMNLRGVIASLRNLAAATKEFASGNSEPMKQLNLQRNDEVGELAQSFSTMTMTLHETTISKDYADDIMNSVAESLLVIDGNKNIETANKSAHITLMYAGEKLAGRHIYELIDIDRYEKLVRELDTHGVVTLDIPIRALDGSLIEMSVAASYMENQSQMRMVLIGQDVSDRRREERELKEAKETAERLLRSKSEFLANMSHELRTPLNGVLGMSQLLVSTELNREQEGYVSTITGSGHHLLSLINDVLDFSKIEAGKMTLEIARFRLRDVIEDTMSMLAANQSKTNVEFMVYYDSNLKLEYMGDAMRLRQILVNFVGNAIKFTERGYLVISAKWINDRDDGRTQLRLEVSDSGIGIPQEKLQSIFDVFSQADGSTTRKYGGTGLGLAISRSMTELMEGSINVSSQPGVGSSFWIEIPLLACDPATLDQPRPPLEGVNLIILHPLSKACSVYMQQFGDWGADVTAVRSVEDLHRRLQFFDKNKHVVMLVDGSIHQKFGNALSTDLIADGFIVDRHLILSEMGQEKTFDLSNEIVGVISKPLYKDTVIKAITGSSHGTSFNHEIVVEDEPIQSFKILLVEDNMVNQRVAAAMLKKMTHEVSLAENGEEAVKIVQMEKFDVILMDCQMPVLDGWEASRQIRNLGPEFETIPIIALTANALAGDREICMDAGMSDYLSKPVKRQDLHSMINRWCIRTKPKV